MNLKISKDTLGADRTRLCTRSDLPAASGHSWIWTLWVIGSLPTLTSLILMQTPHHLSQRRRLSHLVGKFQTPVCDAQGSAAHSPSATTPGKIRCGGSSVQQPEESTPSGQALLRLEAIQLRWSTGVLRSSLQRITSCYGVLRPAAGESLSPTCFSFLLVLVSLVNK